MQRTTPKLPPSAMQPTIRCSIPMHSRRDYGIFIIRRRWRPVRLNSSRNGATVNWRTTGDAPTRRCSPTSRMNRTPRVTTRRVTTTVRIRAKAMKVAKAVKMVPTVSRAEKSEEADRGVMLLRKVVPRELEAKVLEARVPSNCRKRRRRHARSRLNTRKTLTALSSISRIYPSQMSRWRHRISCSLMGCITPESSIRTGWRIST